jgi:hypothetical protein
MNCEDLQALVDRIKERTGEDMDIYWPLRDTPSHPRKTKKELHAWLTAWFQGWQEGEKAGSERPINTGN